MHPLAQGEACLLQICHSLAVRCGVRHARPARPQKFTLRHLLSELSLTAAAGPSLSGTLNLPMPLLSFEDAARAREP